MAASTEHSKSPTFYDYIIQARLQCERTYGQLVEFVERKDQNDTDDHHHKFDSTLEPVKVEENDPDEDDLNEFRNWLQEQISLHFTTELTLPLPSIEDDEEEEESEVEFRKEHQAPLNELLLVEDDSLYHSESNTSQPTKSSTTIPSNQISPSTSLFSPGLSSSCFSDPEFCELFEQHQSVNSLLHIYEDDDEDLENASFTTAPESLSEFEDSSLPCQSRQQLQTNKRSSQSIQTHYISKGFSKQLNLSSSEQLNDNAYLTDIEKTFFSEVDFEEEISEDEESEDEEKESFSKSFASLKQNRITDTKLIEPFDLLDVSSSTASSSPPDTAIVWEDDRDDDEILAQLERISASHNPATIDQAALDPFTACIFCPSMDHSSAVCSIYSTVIERIYRAVHEQHRCSVCLRLNAGHSKGDCPLRTVTVCPQCDLAHAEMLFHVKRVEKKEKDKDYGCPY